MNQLKNKLNKMEFKKGAFLLGAMFFTLFWVSTASALNTKKIDKNLWEQMNAVGIFAQDITYVVELQGVSALSLANFGGDRAAFKKTLAEMNQNAQIPLTELAKILQEVGHITSIEPLWIANYAIVTGSAESVSQVSDLESVQHIYYNQAFKLPDNPESQTPKESAFTWGLESINVKGAWAQGITGKGVTVAILDTGADSTHPDLAGKISQFKNVTDDVGSTNGFDGQGHGSHTAGTIVGGDAGGTHIGVAPGSKLVVGKIFTAAGRTKLEWILKAMQWAADPDENLETDDTPGVCSNSWGGRQGSAASEKPMWDIVARWRELGIVPVFANGNSGPKPKTTGTPGGYPHSFAVGATQVGDGMAYFSSRGPITWEGKTYVKPDISAPGHNVTSVKDGGGYRTISGTSMACPHVAGLCALVLQANPSLSVSQVEKIIESTSADLGSSGKDNDFGHGRIDANAAVAKALGMVR